MGHLPVAPSSGPEPGRVTPAARDAATTVPLQPNSKAATVEDDDEKGKLGGAPDNDNDSDDDTATNDGDHQGIQLRELGTEVTEFPGLKREKWW